MFFNSHLKALKPSKMAISLTSVDPLRELLDDLHSEFNCLHRFSMQYREFLQKREAARKAWQRCWVKFRGKDSHGRGASQYEDRSFEIKRKLEKLEDYFRDMKSRYLWAQCRLSEQSISWIRSTAFLRSQHSSKFLRNRTENSEEYLRKESILREVLSDNRSEKKVDSKVNEDSKLIQPVNSTLHDKQPSTDDGSTTTPVVHHGINIVHSQSKGGNEAEAENFEANMLIVALLKEIEEKNECIDKLKNHLRTVEAENTQLRDNIRRRTLGLDG